MAMDFKSETDVKDYVERLGIEYRFGCYSEKKPEGEIEIRINSVTKKNDNKKYFSVSFAR